MKTLLIFVSILINSFILAMEKPSLVRIPEPPRAMPSTYYFTTFSIMLETIKGLNRQLLMSNKQVFCSRYNTDLYTTIALQLYLTEKQQAHPETLRQEVKKILAGLRNNNLITDSVTEDSDDNHVYTSICMHLSCRLKIISLGEPICKIYTPIFSVPSRELVICKYMLNDKPQFLPIIDKVVGNVPKQDAVNTILTDKNELELIDDEVEPMDDESTSTLGSHDDHSRKRSHEAFIAHDYASLTQLLSDISDVKLQASLMHLLARFKDTEKESVKADLLDQIRAMLPHDLAQKFNELLQGDLKGII